MERFKNLLAISLLLLSIFFWSGPAAVQQMIADITEDVETEFGTYHPYLVDVDPCVEPYTIEPDFSNVVNFNDFTFSDADKELLLQNGFVVKPSHYKQIYDVYNECGDMRTPAFVTTDAVLHTYHILYDYMLRILEVLEFTDDLSALNEAMLAKAESMYAEATDPDAREAARRNVAYFAVGSVLLDSTTVIPSYVDSLVEAELDLIEAHEFYEYSPIFCYWEDYSQYLPRGHYTRKEILKRYFKSMMWYGRISFAVRNTDHCPDIALPQTLQAVLITQALNDIEIEGEPALDLWARIYDPTVFFVGKSDDLNIYQYFSIAKQVYGVDFANFRVDSLGNETLLNEFLVEADKLPGPMITTWTPKGFRFMGQRFIPDSYMFDRLVAPFIDRLMPKGLDVMSILGSVRAYQILDEIYHETSHSGYSEMMDSLKVEFESLPDSLWAQNLYWNWLYCLMPLLFAKGEGYPLFMRNQAWTDKELSTSLGSWGELRHDTILYAKQSGTEGGPPQSWFTKGYVEPNPYLYARLAGLARFMITGFGDRGLLLEEFRLKLEELESLLLTLKDISIKELTNQALSEEEYDLLCHFGEMIEDIVTFPPEISGQIENDIDDDMAVIADVHTHAYITFTCLEEEVGYPLEIFVIVSVEDTVKVTKGAIFSHYEFTRPISQRLTDEEWQEIQISDNPKLLPVWMASFIDTSQSFLNPYPWHYSLHMDTEVPPEETPYSLPEVFSLQQNHPNPFNANTVIRYSLFVDRPCPTTLKIYNITGQEVRTLVDQTKDPGFHTVIWDGRDDRGNPVASGVYFYRLKVGGFIKTRMMILIR